MLGFTRTASSVVLIGCSFMLLAGCGGGGDGFTGPRGQVSGKVTFNGQPVPAGSTVVFQTGEGKSYLASGVVEADGTYELQYDRQANIPGVKYLVQITPPAGAAGDGTPVDPMKMDMTKTDVKQAKKSAKSATSVFPAKYFSSLTSGLSFEVKKGGNTADFDLQK